MIELERPGAESLAVDQLRFFRGVGLALAVSSVFWAGVVYAVVSLVR
jgi:hypothetical protein